MENSFFDNDKFISVIRGNAPIWDKRNAGYCIKNKHEMAWRNVLHAMFGEQGSESWNDEKIMKTVEGLQAQWKNLRNSFNREVTRWRTKPSGNKKSWKTYLYYEQMTFLLPYMSKAMTTDTYGNDETEQEFAVDEPGEVSDVPMDHHDSQADMEPELQSQGSQGSRKRKSISVPTTRQKSKEEVDPELVHVLKKSLEWRQEKEDKETSDADCLFLLSLLSDFKKVPASQKAHVKIAMIQAIASNHHSSLTVSTPSLYHHGSHSSSSSTYNGYSSSHPPSPFNTSPYSSSHSLSLFNTSSHSFPLPPSPFNACTYSSSQPPSPLNTSSHFSSHPPSLLDASSHSSSHLPSSIDTSSSASSHLAYDTSFIPDNSSS